MTAHPPPATHHPPPTAAAVVVAAGLGSRLGAPAKALLPLAGRPALAWSLDALEAADEIASVVVVAGAHTREAIETLLADGAWPKARAVVLGGARRQDSVLAGLLAGDPAADVVAVHDAARPLAPAALFDACVRAARQHGAAIAAAPVSDTLKRVAEGQVRATVDRAGLWAAQTPQAVRRDLLLAGFARADEEGRAVTDEASLCEALGIPVAIVPASADNLKVTHPADVALADALLRARFAARDGASGAAPGVGGEQPDAPAAEPIATTPAASPPFGSGGERPGDHPRERFGSPGSDHTAPLPESLPPAGSPDPSGVAGFPAREASAESTAAASSPRSADAAPSADGRETLSTAAIRSPQEPAVSAASRAPRTGIGYDVHRFAPNRRLLLGGVEIAHPEGLGLEGHSDADVLLHAVCDALLGAAGLGDIGHFFPPGDPRFAGADSRDLLRESARLVRAAGFLPANVDASLVAETPRIGPHVPAMRAAIAACLALDPSAVGVKATTNEGMGFVGRGEGIAALAVATVMPM